MHSILIVGQSNMGGRGFKGEITPIHNPKLNVLRNGKWRPMYIPVNPDRITSGVNLAETFADAYANDHDVDTGIIPCADGGSSVSQWMPGELLYDHAIMQATLAQRTSEIVAVLWHQGESDCYEDRYPLYEEKCLYVLEHMRKDLSLTDVPFVVGGLGDYLKDYPDDDAFKNYIHINKSLENIADKVDWIGFASAKGLTSNPDFMHFNAASLYEFGLRYYEQFKKLENPQKVIKNTSVTQGSATPNIELL